jgi:SagB-type dehydrogenase family enzyme
MKDFTQKCLNGAFWNNGYAVYTQNDKTIGFRAGLLQSAQAAEKSEHVGEDFLLNSQMKRGDREREFSIGSYFTDVAQTLISLIDERDEGDLKKISLSKGVPLSMELGLAMAMRRSCRSFTKDPVDFDYLSTILKASMGVSADQTVRLSNQQDHVTIPLRMVPSAGGLYPVSLYLAVYNVSSLERGIYIFNPKKNSLIQIFDETILEPLLKTYSAPKGTISIEEAGAIAFLIGMPWRSMRKYGNRGLRFMFHEAGGISQNFHLATTCLGLGSVDCGGFYDEEVHKLLNIDGVNQSFLHAIFLGMPSR